MSEKPAITLQTTIKHAADIFWQPVVDDVVMLNVERGEYFGSEDVGARIWQLIEHPISIAELCEQLIAQYNVERETCETEVLAFVTQLHQAGLIEVLDGNGS